MAATSVCGPEMGVFVVAALLLANFVVVVVTASFLVGLRGRFFLLLSFAIAGRRWPINWPTSSRPAAEAAAPRRNPVSLKRRRACWTTISWTTPSSPSASEARVPYCPCPLVNAWLRVGYDDDDDSSTRIAIIMIIIDMIRVPTRRWIIVLFFFFLLSLRFAAGSMNTHRLLCVSSPTNH